MSLEEIIGALTKDVTDEESDHEKYMKLAEALEEKFPSRGYGGIIKDIAHEEAIHRAHIHDILADMGADMGEEADAPEEEE